MECENYCMMGYGADLLCGKTLMWESLILMAESLIFVDTNIWLDFYRSKTEAGLTLLKHLDAVRNKTIITYQVEMEFKKHRQAVILESIRELKPPSHIPRPGLFSDAKAVKALGKKGIRLRRDTL